MPREVLLLAPSLSAIVFGQKMNTSVSTVWSRIFTVASILIYLVSLFSPGFAHDKGHVAGTEALELGWFPAIFGVLASLGGDVTYFGTLSWVANPLMLVIWWGLFRRWRPTAIVASVGALCLSTLFLLVHTIPIPDGQTMEHVHAQVGYFFWIGSMVLGLIGALLIETEMEGPKIEW